MGERYLDPADEQAILRLQARYGERVDAADVDGVVDLFTEDAVIDYGHGRLFEGREAIRGMYEQVLAGYVATSHHVGGVVAEPDDEGGATATSAVYAVHRRAADGARVEIWGRYLDRLARDGGGWRIARRAIRAAMWDGIPDGDDRFERIERRA